MQMDVGLKTVCTGLQPGRVGLQPGLVGLQLRGFVTSKKRSVLERIASCCGYSRSTVLSSLPSTWGTQGAHRGYVGLQSGCR